MRKKYLKSIPLHVDLGNKATELYCEVLISTPDDYTNQNVIKCIGVWDTGSQGCMISQ